jgi:lipopolysaccharide export system permease protein
MKLVDRYMLKGFAFSFLVVYVSMVGLTIMVDMVVNFDEFLKTGSGQENLSGWPLIAHMGRYYFYRLFEYFQWLCGAAMLVGGAFAVARLNKHNELVAFKASGVSVYRLLAPIFAAGVVVSALYVVNQELIIPGIIDHLVNERSTKKQTAGFEIKYVRDANNAVISAPIYLPESESMVARVIPAADDAEVSEGRRIPVQIVLRSPQDEVLAILQADRAVYDRQRRGWTLIGGQRRDIRPVADVDQPGAVKDSDATPCDFYRSELDPQSLRRQERRGSYRYLSHGQLQELLDESILTNPAEYEVVMHQHFSKPLLNLVVLLLGLPFVIGREGKSYFVSIVTCIGLFVLVLGTEQAAVDFATAGHLAPVLGAYLPILVFTPLGVVCMDAIRT